VTKARAEWLEALPKRDLHPKDCALELQAGMIKGATVSKTAGYMALVHKDKTAATVSATPMCRAAFRPAIRLMSD
jgi:hypothetical protein